IASAPATRLDRPSRIERTAGTNCRSRLRAAMIRCTLPTDDTRKHHAREIFAGLPRHYDRAGAALSFGQDPRWRAALVAAVTARPGERILDVATGTGLVAAALVRRYGATVVGVDQSPEMLAGAAGRLAREPALARMITLVE